MDSKQVKQLIFQYVEAREKRIVELEDIIGKKERTEREAAQRLYELESTVANLETQNDLLKSDNESMKNFLQAKHDMIRLLEEKLKEGLEKEQKTISKLNDEAIAIMDENILLKRKNARLLSGLERCQDDLQYTMASISETNVGSAFSTASTSSYVPSAKKMKSSDMTKESTFVSSPSIHLSPSTLRVLLGQD
jgi:hypothetical protein